MMGENLKERLDELEAVMLRISDNLEQCAHATVAQAVIGRATLEVLAQLYDGAPFVIRDRALEIAGALSPEIRAVVGAAFAMPPNETRQ